MSRSHHHRRNDRPATWQMTVFGVVVAVLVVLALTGWRHQQADKRTMERFDATLPAVTYPAATIPAVASNFATPTVAVAWSGRPLRVLFVGDSISAGWYANSRDDAYPALVETGLERHGQVTATVDAVPGVTTSYWTSRPLPTDQDLVVVELGTNDWAKSSPGQFAIDYPRLLAHVKATDGSAQVLCLSIWRPDDRTTKAMNQTIANGCPGLYLDITTLYGTSGPAGRTTWLGAGDNFHPNDAGHRRIAETVLGAVRFH